MEVGRADTRVREKFVLTATTCSICKRAFRLERMYWVEVGPWVGGKGRVLWGCHRCTPIPEMLAAIIHKRCTEGGLDRRKRPRPARSK